MSKRLLSVVTGAVITLLAVTSYGPTVSSSAAQNQSQAGCQTFKETGKTVCGSFLSYWNTHGGLAQQGYPISSEFKEVSDTDGKMYTVQYFERAVFEAHPENKAPYDVLLSLLGTMFYKQRYPNGAQELPPDMRPEPGMTFPETGKQLRGVFLEYWKSHGGLMQQGYPISNLISEKSELDGKTYTVQYFERAVFELHPENKPPNDVLLSQLGTLRYKQKYPFAATTAPGVVTTLPDGQWGGKGVGFWIQGKSIHLEFDCAHSLISTPVIGLDASGNFTMEGMYTFEGGPALAQDSTDVGPNTVFARFTGTVKGDTMTLTVNITSPTSTTPNGQMQTQGTFTLTRDAEPSFHKCM